MPIYICMCIYVCVHISGKGLAFSVVKDPQIIRGSSGVPNLMTRTNSQKASLLKDSSSITQTMTLANFKS